VVVFISERGLAFRCENETFRSPKNGNYLGILELIAKYDHFLNDYIKKKWKPRKWPHKLIIIKDL
jgi:hypothetical protein